MNSPNTKKKKNTPEKPRARKDSKKVLEDKTKLMTRRIKTVLTKKSKEIVDQGKDLFDKTMEGTRQTEFIYYLSQMYLEREKAIANTAEMIKQNTMLTQEMDKLMDQSIQSMQKLPKCRFALEEVQRRSNILDFRK